MKTNPNSDRSTRRTFLKSAGAAAAVLSGAGAWPARGQTTNKPAGAVAAPPAAPSSKPVELFDARAGGIRILPGQWRPHYRWEQIAWISPAWSSHDYLWLDFPEAIFSSQGLLFLSHVSPKFPVVFPDLPAAPWQEISNGLAFERRLPNGILFGGSVVRKSQTTVGLELHIENGSREALTDIKLQTCLYLRAIKEFAEFTNENKFVHLPDLGWQSYPKANEAKVEAGRYRLGWRAGRALADWSLMATVSNDGKRLVAFTWLKDGFSLVCNARHPCMHSDPQFPDLAPGAKASIHGEIIFFDGTLDDFSAYLEKSGSLPG